MVNYYIYWRRRKVQKGKPERIYVALSENRNGQHFYAESRQLDMLAQKVHTHHESHYSFPNLLSPLFCIPHAQTGTNIFNIRPEEQESFRTHLRAEEQQETPLEKRV